ncbi:sigma-70 family RNA polymerase sigma factor [Clostridium cochlearium]|uniref:sigma-70 family RNA polymerase sigma factor n=1 Tax=Clostridium cochlearium TaxID=1494 RepID=UPI000BBC5D6F|nr:sigma-70 family RNA polymerase sigma factor [Clostridium cochlearium]
MDNLLCKAKCGDKEAFEEIINSFMPLILKESSKYIIKCYDYEDLVQHGYLSVIKAVNMFRGESEGFTPYCIKAIQLNYKALLKGEIKHHREIPDEFTEDKPDYMFTLEDEILAFEKTEKLYNALDKLSSEERDIINSFYIKEKSLDEIAATTNKSYNNIRYLKSKAVKKLQKTLSR